MARSLLFSLIACVAAGCCYSAIIPNELPTLLSVIYSNIPPVRFGVDSKLGFGFRLGPHSDFQTVIEIGPQQSTGPLAPDEGAKRRRTPSKTSTITESVNQNKPNVVPELKRNQITNDRVLQINQNQLTREVDSKETRSHDIPKLPNNHVTREEDSKFQKNHVTREEVPKLQKNHVTRAEVPKLQTNHVTREEVPKLQTNHVTRAEVPKLQTNHVTRAEVPKL